MSGESESLVSEHNNYVGIVEHMEETHDPGTNNESTGLIVNEDILSVMQKKTSSFSTLMSFLKGCIGTGILALPIAFKYSGLWVGLVCLILTAYLSTYLMHVLLRTAVSVIDRHDLDASKIDYAEAVFYVIKFGPVSLRRFKGKIKHTVNIFLLLTQIGFCCIYVLFIAQNIDYFILAMWSEFKTNLYLIGFIVAVFLIPASQLRNMRVFGFLSALAMLFTIAGLSLIFAYVFSTGLQDYTTFPVYQSFRSTLIGLSIFIFSFEGIGLTLPLRNRMINPHKFTTVTGVLNTSMVLVTALCSLLAFFGYLCFGENIRSSITYNISKGPIIYAFIQPLFIVSIVISYILQFYIPATIFARLMLKIRCHREASEFRQSINRKIIRTGIVLFTYAIAMVVPHLDLMVSLLGAVSSTMLALIIPPALELIHLWPERQAVPYFWITTFMKHSFFIFFGFICLIGGTVATVIQIVETR